MLVPRISNRVPLLWFISSFVWNHLNFICAFVLTLAWLLQKAQYHHLVRTGINTAKVVSLLFSSNWQKPILHTFSQNIWVLRYYGPLSIQQKFSFEILEIPHAQWWYIPVAQIETTILSNGKGYFGSTAQNDKTRPVKVDHLKRRSQIFRSDQMEMVCFICWFLTK